jgi:hypothetical protein
MAALSCCLSSVTSLSGWTREPKVEHLARSPDRSPETQRFGHLLGLVEQVAGAHAERIVDGQHGDFAGVLGGIDLRSI